MSTMQILITAIASAMLWIPLNQPLVCGAPPKGAKAHNKKHVQEEYFFWNELTGDVQWEDPGDVPFEDDNNLRYWPGVHGEKLSEDPHMLKYSWVEFYSEDLQKTYYYNQETRESTWEKPHDLGWRRIRVKQIAS